MHIKLKNDDNKNGKKRNDSFYSCMFMNAFIIKNFMHVKMIFFDTHHIFHILGNCQISISMHQMTFCMPKKHFFLREGLFRCKVFLYRAYILEVEQSSLDEMKGI